MIRKLFYLLVLVFLGYGKVVEASSQPTIVFVHLGSRLPDHLEIAVEQARLFNQESTILLIAHREALATMSSKLRKQKPFTIACESLQKTPEHRAFLEKSSLPPGFWLYTSERFLYLYDAMVQYKLERLFHLENDNMLYVDLKELFPLFQRHYSGIAATFDNDERCIAGLVYVGSQASMRSLAHYFAEQARQGYNDMQMVALFKRVFSRSVIDSLPIIPEAYAQHHLLRSPLGHTVRDAEVFYRHSDLFESIFDAAALGQYLGGADIFIHPHIKAGFCNESCIFNPSLFTYVWQRDVKGRNIPYAVYRGKFYRINNLHVHSKQLYLFSSK